MKITWKTFNGKFRMWRESARKIRTDFELLHRLTKKKEPKNLNIQGVLLYPSIGTTKTPKLYNPDPKRAQYLLP
jgi:hypothetical protein